MKGLAEVKGIGAATLKKLASLDINTTAELINFLPKSYIDFSKPVRLAEARDGQFSLLKLNIIKVSGLVKTKGGLQFFTADAQDFGDISSSKKAPCKLVWYNQPYMIGNVKAGDDILCYGKVKFDNNRIELINPQIDSAENPKKLVGIMPVYRARGSVKQGNLRAYIGDGLKGFQPTKIITDKAIDKNGLSPLAEAYYKAHFPISAEEGYEAQRRIALEDTVKEIIYFKILNRSAKNSRYFKYDLPFSVLSRFVNTLPFELTQSQKIAVREILDTLKSNMKMNRLLIGDVGSGKTIVALLSMLYAVKCGYQVAIMAPTEILAAQHMRTATAFFKDENLHITYLSGSVKGAEKKQAEKDIKDGTANVIIGTHSLFQKGIEFNNLSLVVIDEQHKFGVAQKYNLQQKGVAVDTLTLTATPIPRSVLMLLYDELQLSRIDKNHDTSVTTRVVSDNKKSDMFSYIRDEAKKGNQAFIVCPKIFDGEGVETYSAISLYKDLKEGAFADINVALIHGKLKAAEKNEIMEGFANGRIDVLVSTTVIEVGIDIKNATTIAVLNSERFGLATLHQLRGRVGRGDKPAFCFLHTSEPDNPRLTALTEFSDGFKLSELDFTLRGGGDYLGTRQSGETDGGKFAVSLTPDMIIRARDIAVKDLLPEGIELTKTDYDYYAERFKDVTVS